MPELELEKAVEEFLQRRFIETPILTEIDLAMLKIGFIHGAKWETTRNIKRISELLHES